MPELIRREALRMQGIVKRYGNVRALDDIDFELRGGEVMALLGENGAGKSTLVKILAGLVKPDAGTIRVDGVTAELGSSRRSQTAGVAVVQQEYSSVGPMSVAENLVLGQAGSGVVWRPRRLRRDARALLDRVGLADVDPRTLVEDLSVAERQLLELARVLARDARIVIFDEPTAALSDAETERVLAVVRQLADSGCSVIYVTHRLPEVFRIADRVTVFRNGKSLRALERTELDADAIVKLMLGRAVSALYPPHGEALGDVVLDVDGLLVEGLREPVSLRVRAGEILGLTGQLGSGAGALSRGLAGRTPAIGGSVTLAGRPLSLRNRAAGIRSGLAYCSADRKLDGIFARLSVRENVSSPWLRSVARGGVVSRRAEARRGREICARVGVDDARFATPVGDLSGGNQQKVALGKWLGTEPSVLLVEEPTRGVDVGARAEIYAQLRHLCAEGLAVIVASSDTAEVHGLSDTIATFYKGRLTAVRARDEWSEEDVVREVMHTEVVA